MEIGSEEIRLERLRGKMKQKNKRTTTEGEDERYVDRR